MKESMRIIKNHIQNDAYLLVCAVLILILKSLKYTHKAECEDLLKARWWVKECSLFYSLYFSVSLKYIIRIKVRDYSCDFL